MENSEWREKLLMLKDPTLDKVLKTIESLEISKTTNKQIEEANNKNSSINVGI